MTAVWRNWAGNQQARPLAVHRPSTEGDLAAIVKQAAADGSTVKVVGRGHSFTAIALTEGHLVDLDRYDALLHVDTDRYQVTVQAGITLETLNLELDQRGLAMPNLGDIAYQTVAGAISTATHGTGATLRGLAAQVIGMRIVTGDGEVLACSAEVEPEVFHAARVGLGALGAISTVTLQVVPAFNLRVVEEPLRLDAVLADLDAHVDGNDHFEFFWVPHTGWALTKTNNRTTDGLARRRRWREYYDDYVLENGAFGLVCRIGRARPSLIPRLSKALPASGRVEYVDQSYRVFASPRLVQVLRDGVLDPPRGVRRGPQPGPGVRGRQRPAAQLPGRGAVHRARRHPAVDRLRPAVVLHRRARVRGHGARALLRRRRGDHERLRRPAPLGQAPRPDGRDAGAALPRVGASSRPSAAASTPTAASPTPTPTGCSAAEAI